jgi:hypothetical protein
MPQEEIALKVLFFEKLKIPYQCVSAWLGLSFEANILELVSQLFLFS